MITLGWHGGIRHEFEDMESGWSTHDGAAVLLRDGEVIAACEEERFNRVKHSNFFPEHAIKACLRLAGIDFDQVDAVAMNFTDRTRDIYPCDRGLPSIDLFLSDTHRIALSVPEAVNELFNQSFGVQVSDRLFFCHHHAAHIWSTWAATTFDDALLISLDGSGDTLSGVVGVGLGDDWWPIREYPVARSLGDLYSDTIRFLGYRRFDEYKVMGLAPHGDPARFRPLFDHMYRLLDDGQYDLAPRPDRWRVLYDAGLLEHARRAGEPLTQVHKDFAASLQETLERIVLHILAHFREVTKQRHLCLAGGVAHNCSLNGRILRSAGFDSVFVQPAAHDAGGALGAAVAAQRACGQTVRRKALRHVFLGADLGDVESALTVWSQFVTFTSTPLIARHTAERIAAGAVVGWLHGRAEFGPRALGHRSLLADPRDADNVRRINDMIKNRERFRPFAPSILLERLADVVELPPTKADYSFMTFVLSVRQRARQNLGAVTHVDGTARIQSVSRATDAHFWSLIREFEMITGVPVLLNTSLNNHAEPIVNDIDDAIALLLTSPIAFMAIDNYVVARRQSLTTASACGQLCPSVPLNRKLVRRTLPTDHRPSEAFFIESTLSDHFVLDSFSLSRPTYEVLVASDGRASTDDICASLGIDRALQGEVAAELEGLWTNRAIAMKPIAC